MDEPAVRIGVLGPLTLTVNGLPVSIGSAKVRALLACLVLGDDRAVPIDRLRRGLWGLDPPRTADHAIQVHASKLRQLIRSAGAEAPVEVSPAGYRLRANDVWVDATAFERDIADGRAALVSGSTGAAVECFDRARARWRGDPYVDLADDIVIEPEAAGDRVRLRTLRLDVDEEWAEASLALGHHQELVTMLEAAVAEEPLRERRYQQLMLALYDAGRTAAALEVFQRARTTLVEQLGIEPGPLLRRAEQAVLHHDPSLFPGPAERAVVSVRAPAATGAGRFVGRLSEWSRLGAIVSAAGSGSGRLVLVGGPPGIGKSRLVSEVAGSGGPMSVAYGTCPTGGGAPPLWPIIEVLRTLGADRLPPVGSGLDDVILDPVRATVSGQLAPSAAIAALPHDDQAAFRLHDAIAELVITMSRRSPLLIVLDDVHDADAATMGVVVRLAHRVASESLVLLATHRDTVADHSDAFSAGNAVLARLPGVEHFTLGPLAAGEVSTYLSSAGLDPDQLVDAVVDRTEGLPLFVTELVGLLVERHGDPAALDTIPESLSSVLDARLAQLGDARSVIERAGVIGSRFSLDVLARIADTGTDRLLDALTQAERLGLVADLGSGTMSFRHVLITDAAVAGLGAAERAGLHVRIAEILERSSSGDAALRATEAARHRMAALPMGDPMAAATACLAAAEVAHAALADSDTIRFAVAAQRALELAGADDAAARARALTLEGEARTMNGQDAREVLDAAVGQARLADDPLLFGNAVRVMSLSRSTAAVAGDPHLVGLLEEAIAGVGHRGDWLATQLSVDLAMTLYRTDAHPRPQQLCETALQRAREHGEPTSIAFALTGLHQAIWTADTVQRRLELAHEAVVAAASTGLEWHESMAMSFQAADRWELGDVDGAAADLERAVELATHGRRARFIWIARTWQALLALYRGDRDESERRRVEALAAWGPEPNPDAALCDVAQRLILAAIDGEVTDYLPIIRFEAGADPEPLFWHSLLALATAIDGGDQPPPESHASIDAVLSAGLDALLPTVTRLPALAFLAEAAARCGRADAAQAAMPHLEPFAGHHVVMNVYGGGGLCWGVVDQGLALAAATTGDLVAARHWQERTERLLTDTGGHTFLRRSRDLATRYLPQPSAPSPQIRRIHPDSSESTPEPSA